MLSSVELYKSSNASLVGFLKIKFLTLFVDVFMNGTPNLPDGTALVVNASVPAGPVGP
jgi:hypothetical protein